MAADQVYGFVDNALGSYTSVRPVFQNILIAIVILLIGVVAGKLLGKFVKRVLSELGTDKTVKRTTGWEFSLENGISKFITYFTYFVAIIMALDTIGVTSAVLNMIAGIIILVLLISVILAIKDFMPNAMSGIRIKGKKEYEKGAKIKVKGIEGEIEEVGLLETKIKTKNKDVILIPNSIFTKNEIIIKR